MCVPPIVKCSTSLYLPWVEYSGAGLDVAIASCCYHRRRSEQGCHATVAVAVVVGHHEEVNVRFGRPCRMVYPACRGIDCGGEVKDYATD